MRMKRFKRPSCAFKTQNTALFRKSRSRDEGLCCATWSCLQHLWSTSNSDWQGNASQPPKFRIHTRTWQENPNRWREPAFSDGRVSNVDTTTASILQAWMEGAVRYVVMHRVPGNIKRTLPKDRATAFVHLLTIKSVSELLEKWIELHITKRAEDGIEIAHRDAEASVP